MPSTENPLPVLVFSSYVVFLALHFEVNLFIFASTRLTDSALGKNMISFLHHYFEVQHDICANILVYTVFGPLGVFGLDKGRECSRWSS